jgi:putative sterol carrier protein
MAFLNASEFFSSLESSFSDAATRTSLQELGAIYHFSLTGDGGGEYTIDLKALTVSATAPASSDCKVTLTTADFIGVVNGTVMSQQLFMMGRLAIDGDLGLALKLEQVFNAAK